MDGGQQYNPRTVEEVFRDFKSRRAGMIKALTTDVEEFYQQCDPEKENLCLYGFPNERWEVNLPAEEVPPELPEPALGINFARDGMQEKDWLSLVAVHSDAWLLAVAFYFGARFGFDKADRKRLFNMINDLPTIYEVVTGAAKKQSKEKSAVSNHSSSKAKPNPKERVTESQREVPKSLQLKDDEDEEGSEEEEDVSGVKCKCNLPCPCQEACQEAWKEETFDPERRFFGCPQQYKDLSKRCNFFWADPLYSDAREVIGDLRMKLRRKDDVRVDAERKMLVLNEECITLRKKNEEAAELLKKKEKEVCIMKRLLVIIVVTWMFCILFK